MTNQRIKRFICIISVFAMLTSVICSGAMAETETETTPQTVLEDKYVEAFSLLQVLNIYTADEIAAIAYDGTISRAELTKRIIMGMNLKSVAAGMQNKIIFMDVHDKEMAGYINLAAEMGIVNGTGHATFEPDSPATLTMAIKMLLRALGYTYLDGEAQYYQQATRIDLADGVTSTDALTVQDAALLLYNTIHQNSQRISAYGVDYKVMVPDTPWLDVWFDIAYIDGIVDATELTALNMSNPADKDAVSIDGIVIGKVPSEYNEYLGFEVRVYYKNTEKQKEFVYLTDYYSNTKEIIIERGHLISLTTSGVSYYDENEKQKDRKLSASTDFVYNEKAINLSEYSLKELTDAYTQVRIIDSNDDGTANVVFITEGLIYAVDSKDTVSLSIFGKNSEMTDLSREGEFDYTIEDVTGTPLTINDIAEWNVITVVESLDKEYVKIIVSSDSIAGVSQSLTTGEKNYLTVDGQKYEIIKELIDENIIQTGKAGTFYLSADGVIYAANYDVASGDTWVWAVGLRAVGTFSSDYVLGCMEGSTPKFKEYEIANRVNVDGNSVAESSLGNLIPESSLPEVMVIAVNEEGYITKIDTVKKGEKEGEKTLVKRHTGPESADKANGGTLWYNSHGKVFHGRFVVSADSVNYAFPTYDKNAYEDMFRITYAHDEAPYAVSLYSLGEDSAVCDFSVTVNMSKAGAKPDSENSCVPFLYIGEEYDQEEMEAYDVIYYLNTANAAVGVRIPEDVLEIEVEYSNKALDFDGDGVDDYTAKEKKPLSWILDRLEQGDLIRIVSDENGFAGIQHVYDISKRMLVQSQGAYCSTSATSGWADDDRLFAGKLYDIQDGYLRIITDENNYDPATGVGVEIYPIKSTSAGWNNMLVIKKNGEVFLETVSANPAYPGVKQGADNIELVMQSKYGDGRFKMFIDYSDSPY